ncbi:MAG: S-layer homology domain-containing protein, partial [Oscillospiraceae bacterium]|nr:S-layer homology domain-containing protein [Oscillospiraceae bacterium]
MKRIVSITCCLAMLLTLLSGDVLAVRTYVTSDEGTAFIQKFEGYKEFPYMDELGNYYIGYGTKCDPGEYTAGVSEEEAYHLLKESLGQYEDSVNELLLQYSIDVSQQQFDAMVSLTYTVGEQWINPSYRFCSYLINGIENYTEQEVVNAIATWCHRGNSVLEGLAQRRLQEAYLFLYGEYENNGENEYTYIHFDAKGGKVENSTVFYRVGLPYGELPEAQWEDRSFLYWYTEDGVQLTGAEVAHKPMDVTARWVGDGSTAETEDYSNWVNPYSDVAEKDWFYSYVRELSARAVIGGYPDGTFQPSNELKTGEALKLILLAAGYAEQIPVDGHWASGYHALAEQLG